LQPLFGPEAKALSGNYNVSDPRYAWLQQGKYLRHGAVEGDKIKISQYRVQHPHDLAELITRVNAIQGGPRAADK